jgi:uncharacterized protein YbaP (TraB family)
MLRGLKPWGATMLLSVAPVEVERRELGKRPLGDELQLRAYKAGKAVHALESIDERIDLYEGMSDELQRALLINAIDSVGRVEDEHAHMVELYMAGDTAGVLSLTAQQNWAIGEALLSDLLQRAVFQRNARMVERMQRDLAAGNAFIMVGANHLPTRGGVLELLKRQGYKVSRAF